RSIMLAGRGRIVSGHQNPRPASMMLRPYGTRASVRQLLLWEDGDPAVTPGAEPVDRALSVTVDV
ncbi:MAG: hypothetical protein WCI78_03290, partial [Mycobacterium sp.]